MRRTEVDPILVTTATQSPAEERQSRERRYLFTMGLRVVCIIAAIAFARVSWVIAGIAIAGSVVLPWVAVIAANAPKPGARGLSPTLYEGERPRELGER
ncbi:MAG TPA: DUF3099 domain-containing protein [Mycobacteriales bacterium]|nr:DUF3099 domain-containing protein [Mycobacteriales bacterium]